MIVVEMLYGPQHPHTAQSYHNLAINLATQGRAKEGEPLCRKAVAIKEATLGPRHPDTALGYHNLASNLDHQGRAQEAEPIHRQALTVLEEMLGPKHPHTASSSSSLACNLHAQGRFQEAEGLFRKVLAIREEVLGPRHPDTAGSFNNLAVNLEAQGRAREGEALLRKVLAVWEEVLGPKHPHTALSCNNLAANLVAQGRARQAEPLLRQALAIREEILGSRHPDTAASFHNLAANLDAQGRFKDGERLHRQAQAVYEELLGRKHPHTATACNSLATNLQGQARYQEAEPLLRQALAVREQVLGHRHRDTAESCNNLARNLQAQGRAKEAEPLARKALAIFEPMLGPRHPDTALGNSSLAYNLFLQGRFKEAEALCRQALPVLAEVLGGGHPHTAASSTGLAFTLMNQGRPKEAEPFWQRSADGVEVARLRLAASALDRAAAFHIEPHLGLATCRLRLDRPAEAWAAAEAGLGRGLLDDLAAQTALNPDAAAERRDRARASRLAALDQLLPPLLTPEKLDPTDRRRRDELLKERRALDDETVRDAAERSRQAILPLGRVQAGLAADEALVFWLDLPAPPGATGCRGDHWGCVVRHQGSPAWVRLKGSGPGGAWTEDDDKLPRQLRNSLTHAEAHAGRARQLAAQRFDPLLPHLAQTGDLPAVCRLVVVPAGRMAGIPIETLTDRYRVSYVPSGSVLARLRGKHRRLESPTLLALGDPNFTLPGAGPLPEPPEYGLFLSIVLPDGNAARAGLRAGDVLLEYDGTKLTTKADFKAAVAADPVPVLFWRDGKTDRRHLRPGKLGVAFSDDAPAEALRKHREGLLMADARVRSDLQRLLGTRLEVAALAALLPTDKATVLLGSRASEQELDALAGSGKLKEYRLVHLATHGTVDPISAAHSALLLARDRLPGPDEQARRAAAGQQVYTGRLSVETIAKTWQLDADLVTLSACETALGPDGGGEGLLGFAQVLLGKGAHSLVLPLWKVDDTATALLMRRFYQNLLGKRDRLKAPLPKAEALAEAKRWLRSLPRAEVEKLAGELANGAVRADEEPPPNDLPGKAAVPAGDQPFAHPYYWAAFMLVGDPE
jgi:tetratricopeptide (TPR) repeat protein